MPSAVLKGDPSVIQAIQEILAGRGIGAAPMAGCRAAEVVVESRPQGFLMQIEDVDGRRVERMAVSIDSAASVIESWVRGDLASETLHPPVAENPEPDVTVETPDEIEADSDADLISDSGPSPKKALIDLGFEGGGGFDGSVWLGGVLEGCAVLGPTCLGAAAKIGADPSATGDSSILETRRMIIDLLAMLDFPIAFDRVTLRPGLDVGAAFIRSTKLGQDGGGENLVGENEFVENARWEFEVGGHLRGSIELGRGFGLLVGVGVSVLPLADTSPFDYDDTLLASSPRGLVRGVVGLEYSI